MSNLATTVPFDPWSDGEPSHNSVIRGTLIRCVDGRWSAKDDSDLPAQLLAVHSQTFLQCWKGKAIRRPSGEWLICDDNVEL